MMSAGLYLVEKEVEAIVEMRLKEMGAPTAQSMHRAPSAIPAPPSQEAYHAFLTRFAPKAPPMEKYQTWIRNKAAITIQAHFRSSTKTIARHVRKTLSNLTHEEKAPAVSFNADLDSIRPVIQSSLGTNAFVRAINNAPKDWEEHEMISALRDVVQNPSKSPHLWLLASPTRSERQLLNLSSGIQKSKESQREVKAAMKIQKLFRGRSSRLIAMVRLSLSGLAKDQVAQAMGKGLDAMGDLVAESMGKNVWARAVRNAPEDWEEDQMVFAMRDALSSPQSSRYVWLLAKPTKYEKLLMTAFSTKVKAFNANL